MSTISKSFKSAIVAIAALAVMLPGVATADSPYVNISQEWSDRCFKRTADVNKDALSIVNNTVVAHVTIPEGCDTDVSVTTYKMHKEVYPLSSQVAHAYKTVSLPAGTHDFSVELPPAGCYFQYDLYLGGPLLNNDQPFAYYFGHLMDYGTGGNTDCLVTPAVTTTVTPTQVDTVAAVEQPTTLVNTGPGSVAAMIAGISAVAAIGYQTVLRRRNV